MPNILFKFFKITYFFFIFSLSTSYFLQAEEILKKSDSLFFTGKYEEAMRIYDKIQRQNKAASPAMLLKMAYIEENSGNYVKALYYLSLYERTRPSNEALKKMDELAKKYDIFGYEYTDTSFFSVLFRKYRTQAIFAVSILLAFIAQRLIRRKLSEKSVSTGEKVFFFATSLSLLIFLHLNPMGEKAVVSDADALLMSGPSAGSEIAGVAEPGALVSISGKEDVWYKIKTAKKTVYIRENNLLIVE